MDCRISRSLSLSLYLYIYICGRAQSGDTFGWSCAVNSTEASPVRTNLPARAQSLALFATVQSTWRTQCGTVSLVPSMQCKSRGVSNVAQYMRCRSCGVHYTISGMRCNLRGGIPVAQATWRELRVGIYESTWCVLLGAIPGSKCAMTTPAEMQRNDTCACVFSDTGRPRTARASFCGTHWKL